MTPIVAGRQARRRDPPRRTTPGKLPRDQHHLTGISGHGRHGGILTSRCCRHGSRAGVTLVAVLLLGDPVRRRLIPDEEAEKIQTVGQAIDYIKQHSSK